MNRPLITHLRRLSLDDGPGLRTTVFLKGCPLACIWCHNPETIRAGPELLVFADRCLGCADCVPACPERALSDGTPPHLQRELCTACGRCVDVCPTTALQVAGRHYPTAELVELLLRDQPFYQASGGGVTFSGGEPTLFPHYLARVQRSLRARGVHIAVETAGYFSWTIFARTMLPHIDLVLYDLKLFDPTQHRRYTGRGNERILANFVRLCEETNVEVVPRIPLIPGITTTSRNLSALARFVRGRRCRPLQLLPYNPAGVTKRRALGQSPDPALRSQPMTPEEEQAAHVLVGS